MGQVYTAQHRKMKRVVAIKMLPSSSTKSPEAVKRFQREVQAAAKLSHPNIVTAYDADEANGVHFLVMEHVDGQDLTALVKKQGPLSVAQAVDCVVQTARGTRIRPSTRASSTATSSPRICCWTTAAWSRSSTWGWHGWKTP